MKKFSVLVLLFYFCTFGFAELRTIETKYFSIVYDDEYSKDSANQLANNADRIAEEVFRLCGAKKSKKRMLVYLKPNQEQLNGYYTSAPYKHIVVYDALPTDNIISNNTKTLLSVFKHEFTHAVSLNRFFSFTFPHAMREGIAVFAESADGEGRLNDPRVLQAIKQDKIDGTLPKWNDLDMRDTYPFGNWGYIYGGTFTKFLNTVYGEKRYADFWNIKPKWFSNRKFKVSFDKNIDELLADFYQTIKVPDEVTTPTYFFPNPEKSIYLATASYRSNIVVADRNEKKVYIYDAVSGKREKLFSFATSIYNISFSNDGKFLLISSFYKQHDEVQSIIYVYDFENRKFLNEKYRSLRYATFSQDNKFICASEITSQNSKLVLVDRNSKEKKLLLNLNFNADYTNIYNVISISQNEYAVILGNGIRRDIFIISNNGDLQKLNLPPELQAISNLAPANTTTSKGFTFSYILDESLLRMGYYNLDKKELKLLEKDISGGTNYPVLVNTNTEASDLAGEKTFLTVANHSTYDLLCRVNESELSILDSSISEVKISQSTPEKSEFENKKYNPIMKMWHPCVLPNIMGGTNYKNNSYGLLFSSQDVINRLSYKFGFAIMPIPTFAQLNFRGNLNLKDNVLSLLVSDTAKVKTDKEGYRRTGFGFKNAKTIYANKNQTNISFNTRFGSYWFTMLDLTKKNIYAEKFTDTVVDVGQEVKVSYYKQRERLGNKFFAKDIFGVGNNFDFSVAYNIQKKLPAFQIQDAFKFATPVVPFSLELFASFAYNCVLDPVLGDYIFAGSPATLSKSYLPVMKEHQNYYNLKETSALNYAFGGQATLRIFSIEIQKVLSWMPICFNRFNIDIGYKAVLNQAFSDNKQFLQSAFVGSSFSLNGVAELGLVYAHPIAKGAKIGSFNFSANVSY